MNRVPIKLLSNTNVRNRLLKLKNENAEIDKSDYIESRIETNAAAKNLMAIEDAAEIAKQLLQSGKIFEHIGKDIKAESGKDFKFQARKTSNMTKPVKVRMGIDYVHMAHTYPDGDGHYALARVDHTRKTIRLFDSMGSNRKEFKKELRVSYGNRYKITARQSSFQPTGGFVTTGVNNYNNLTKGAIRNPDILKKSFEISQYDELSQHHFCYIEAYVAMMHETIGTPFGPSDPLERLVFIKTVLWGLIHKYVPKAKQNTPEWRYFVTNFPYFMQVTNTDGKRFKLKHISQIPGSDENIKKTVLKMKLRDNIDSSWSLKRIMEQS